MSYVNINEVVDHYFPPVATLVKGGGENYTDFKYWRDEPLELDEFSASDSEELDAPGDNESTYTDEEEEEIGDGLVDSYISRGSMDESLDGENVEDDEEGYEEGDDEGEYDEDDATSDAEAQLVDRMAKAKVSHKGVEEDIGAEIITGVGHLSQEKKA
jgi:phosphatidate phosphatase LPIN